MSKLSEYEVIAHIKDIDNKICRAKKRFATAYKSGKFEKVKLEWNLSNQLIQDRDEFVKQNIETIKKHNDTVDEEKKQIKKRNTERKAYMAKYAETTNKLTNMVVNGIMNGVEEGEIVPGVNLRVTSFLNESKNNSV
jgi:hypothetical protein